MPANMTIMISKCRKYDRGFLSLFSRKKEKQKKLAAADKSAKILSSSLDKNKLASLRQYFCLNRSTTKFLNAISPRRQGKIQWLKFLLNPWKSVEPVEKRIKSHRLAQIDTDSLSANWHEFYANDIGDSAYHDNLYWY